jgi:hypothetical protein
MGGRLPVDSVADIRGIRTQRYIEGDSDAKRKLVGLI